MSLRDQALAPNRTITEDTFALAWDLLLRQGQGADATDDERCRAKCFLTYRAVEGTVSYADWVEKVQPVATLDQMKLTPGKLARWKASQWSAEVYLSILQTPLGDEAAKAGSIAASVAQAMKLQHCLNYHCPAIQNYLRMVVIDAYALLLSGERGCADLYVEKGIQTWRESISAFDHMRHPFRWTEARDDLFVLQALTFIRQRAETGTNKVASFMGPLELRRQQEHLAWMQCLIKLEGGKGGMWSDEHTED